MKEGSVQSFPVCALVLDEVLRLSHLEPLLEREEIDWRFDSDAVFERASFSEIDVGICTQEFGSKTALRVSAFRQMGIPVCHIVDGILEWRNLWENPRSLHEGAGLPIYQPVLSDRIVCIGDFQKVIMESLGNKGKCEPIGLPRLDAYWGIQKGRDFGKPVKDVLVATANTAGFTGIQKEKAIRALADLKRCMDQPMFSKRVRPIWRVDASVAEKLGLRAEEIDLRSAPLPMVLQEFDALVCTPSTVLLEGMLAGIPSCCLDYTNSPRMVLAAWEITAAEQMSRTLGEIVVPNIQRLAYQDTLLSHQVAQGRATERVVGLIQSMARGENGSGLREDIGGGRFSLGELNPNHSVFRQFSLEELQAVVGHLEKLMERDAALELENKRLQRERGLWWRVLGQVRRLRVAGAGKGGG